MNKEPELRHHSTQKNYIAIWYSLILHLFMFIIIVNVWEIDFSSMLGEMWKDITGNNEKVDLTIDESVKEIIILNSAPDEIPRYNPLPEN
jgi:F0F1-type ATP synthase membrane subunit a